MVIGIDIGGTKCAVAKCDSAGHILKKLKFPTTGYEETMQNIVKSVKEIGAAQAIGISCGGPLDSKNGRILSPPNLPGWDDIPIVQMLEHEFGIPAYLQNDANAGALAEWKFGAGKGTQNMIFLTFGTGMGAGFILNGALYEGTNGMAGEVGHVRLRRHGPVGYGKAGSFEGFCSGAGLAQLGKLAADKQFRNGKSVSFCPLPEQMDSITAKKISECAKAGHADAIEIFRHCGEKLGAGMAILIDLLNPQKIVVGSIYARCEQLLAPAMTKVLQRECLASALSVCEIVPAQLGEEIGDYAALAVAMEGVRHAE